ncbi:MAG: hypothetical protein PVJ73_20205 [Acidobacteriota bacterium]|jgi:hypothetical protein
MNSAIRELLDSLDELREPGPHIDLALQIHESVLLRPAQIGELRTLVRAISRRR